MMAIPYIDVLTIASLTLTFYAIFANLLYKNEDRFSIALFLILLINMCFVAISIIIALYYILLNQLELVSGAFYYLMVSWIFSVGIIFAYTFKVFILNYKDNSIFWVFIIAGLVFATLGFLLITYFPLYIHVPINQTVNQTL